jgi:hypothetical protein
MSRSSGGSAGSAHGRHLLHASALEVRGQGIGGAVHGLLAVVDGLRAVRYRVVASPTYLRRHGRPGAPSDLADCDCLRFPLPGFRTTWTFRELASDKAPSGAAVTAAMPASETVQVRGWMVGSTSLALHRTGLDGLGPALLADWLVDADAEAGRLLNLFPRHEASATDFDSAVWLLHASRSHLSARVLGVVGFLKEAMA